MHDPDVFDRVLVLALDLLDLDHVFEPLFLDLHIYFVDFAGVLDINDGLRLLPLSLGLLDASLPLLALHFPLEDLLALVNEHLLDVQLHLLNGLFSLIDCPYVLVVSCSDIILESPSLVLQVSDFLLEGLLLRGVQFCHQRRIRLRLLQ